MWTRRPKSISLAYTKRIRVRLVETGTGLQQTKELDPPTTGSGRETPITSLRTSRGFVDLREKERCNFEHIGTLEYPVSFTEIQTVLLPPRVVLG